MYISSPGGEVASGLAIYDIMHSIKCPIRTVCMGTAASFGAVLFAAGQRREMLPHSRLMIHDPLIAGNGITGSATSLAERVGDLMKNRKILGTLLAKNTGKPYNISRICRLLTGAEENAICVCDNLMVIHEIYAV